MKKLIVTAALLPGVASAHGMHAPVDPALHSFAHIVPGVMVIALATVLGLMWRARK